MSPIADLGTNVEQMDKTGITGQPKIEDDSIVISGIAGLFPMSNNLKEFHENLYNKVNMISNEPRFKLNHPELQPQHGKIPLLSPFDAQFFGIHAKLAKVMDPMARKLLEQSYQAIYDAGVSVDHVRDMKLGVFVGACFSETEKTWFYSFENRSGLGLLGCCRAMFANRISYWLDAKGPSMAVDSLCASSLVALELAVEAIRRGDCDAAIVGSANAVLHPQLSILLGRSVQLSPNGIARSFDKNADGTVRAEAVNVIFLQKAKDAKRIYAEVCHVQCTIQSGNDNIDGSLRTVPVMRDFFTNFYKKANVSPNQVEYMEAYGIGIPEADRNELKAIGDVFCKDRSDPLLVGSVVSNMGCSDASSGLCSIIKICLGYHSGKYAANLHYEQPHDDVETLRDGRMRVVKDHTPSNYGYTAVNNFAIGGVNSHVLLKGHNIPKQAQKYNASIPYLVTMSGRHEPAVQHIIDDLKGHAVDAEEIALLHHIHERSTIGHMARGYCILTTSETNETKVLSEKNDYFADVKRPVWFVYSGMGSQWATMGTELMRLPIFAAAIERCRRVLEPKGVDIVDIITNPEKTMFDNILHSFVGIAAVQIGLTDVLRELGIVPDKIIGHSVGELGCAYADGCFTAEEMILSAYSRGLVSVQTPFIHGSMAAVGLGFSTVSKMCPPEIEVACHNSAESCTISGPSEIMKEFVAKLTAQGVFAKEVPCSNIAYHSRYIAEAGPKLRKYLSEIIPNPKPRSEKWLSTSVPQERWNEESAKYSSADYHTNNLLNPVLFEETARLIPSNAITIEIAPHGLLQAIIKRSLGDAVTNIPLTRRGHSDPITFLLNAIGQMYIVGMNPKLSVLYPKMEFPVSTGTGTLSHLTKWVHTEPWTLAIYIGADANTAAQRNILISTHDDEYKFIEDCVIDDRIVLPLSSILVIVWETFVMVHNGDNNLIPIQITNLHYCHEAIIHRNELVKLTINIQRGSGRFEVTNDNNLMLYGYLNKLELEPEGKLDEEVKQAPVVTDDVETYDLDLNDIYKIMFRRGYAIKNSLRGIQKSNFDFTKAEVAWNDNWTTFLDSMLQLGVLARKHTGVSRPKFIRQITIDTETQNKDVVELKNLRLKASVQLKDKSIACSGVSIEGIEYVDNPPVHTPSVLKKREFLPFNIMDNVTLSFALHAYLQIVEQNITTNTIRAVEIKDSNDGNNIGETLFRVAKELIGLDLSLKRVTAEEFVKNEDLGEIDLVLGNDIIANEKIFKELSKILLKKAFILSIDTTSFKFDPCYTVVATSTTPIGQLALIKWHLVTELATVTCLSVDKDCALLKYTKENLKNNDRFIITSKYPAEPSLTALVGQWSKENNNIQLYLSDEKLIGDEHFNEGSKRNLTYNVFKNGVWGSEVYLPIEKEEPVRDFKLANIPGYLDCLKWVETPSNGPADGIRVKVHYAGPSYYDIQKASGQVPINGKGNYYGMDFSGVTQSGTKVMGLISEGSIGSSVIADPHFIWPIPAHWSLEDAATVPLPYLLAFYCLFIKAELQPGSTIFVHGGTGALGQAVISIALGQGCKVFTTVSTVQKKKFLMKLFPALPEANIGNSRDGTFETTVMCGTNGKGCDIVISSLKGELREASMKCVNPFGKFIDVNSHDINKNVSFKMDFLSFERNYVPANISYLCDKASSEEKIKLQGLLIEGIKQGCVRPLSRVTYAPQDVARAFKLLATSSHRGRVLLRMNQLTSLAASPSIICSPHSSYIVLCGQNEFGIDVADRLVVRGARNLIIHCDTKLNTGLLRQKINSWKEIGVKVIINIEPLHENNNQLKLLNKSIGVGPVEGVIIADEYKPIVLDGLDRYTRKLCSNLKYFAILRFNAEEFDLNEQSILNSRSKIRLPITIMQYPAIHKFDDAISDGGTPKVLKQNIYSALSALEAALRLNSPLPVCTYAVSNNEANILEDLSSILGVNITEKLPPNTCLHELGLDIEKAELTSRYLERVVNKPFDREEIGDLTIAKLLEMNAPIYDKTRKESSDLSLFFTRVDPEELETTIEMVIMDTKVTIKHTQDQFNANETYLVVIPGLEGHYTMFNRLCERLKLYAIVLQPVLEQYNDSVEEIAARLLKVMKKNINLNGKKFYLLGYSFGSLVAMEMASLLEAQGLEGTVYCVDSSPAVFQKQLNRVIGHMTEPQLQDSVAELMCRLMTSNVIEPLKKELALARNWDEKVLVSLRHLKGRVPYSAQYARLLIESAYGRICAARNYNPNNLLSKLNAQVILLKGRVPKELNLDYDYGLSKYSNGKVVVYELDCDHLETVQDLRCSNIVNRHLDEDITKAFSQLNLCDTYFGNSTQFIGVTQ